MPNAFVKDGAALAPQPYGDLLQLNTARLLADSVARDVLQDIVKDYLDLLETSAAVYEKNGDYALGIFSSGYCRFMDLQSRNLCGTGDNRVALASGKWHCHESCWETSRLSIENKEPIDRECAGGIRLYAVPVIVNGEVVGSLNIGYGAPPSDLAQLEQIAARYQISIEELQAQAATYVPRSQAIIDNAKQRLRTAAKLIGAIIERQQAEDRVRALNATLEARVAERTRALEESERRFRAIFHSQFQFIGVLAPTGEVLEANRTALVSAGTSVEAVVGRLFWETAWWTHDREQQDRLKEAVRRAARGERVRFEASHPTASGSLLWVDFSLTPVLDERGEVVLLIPEGRDITQRKHAEQQLLGSLREKEVLLKEIHHRVKNNLQIVSTLLDLQSAHTQDPQALEMFSESRGRVRSMALIHERLYRSQDLARVDFAEYVRHLAADLYRSYRVSDDCITLQVEVEVSSLPIDTAIPCGLLINELLSNCLKHAFRDRTEGWIRVMLRGGEGHNLLSVADNGVGFPAELDFRHTASFGLQLVHTLVEQLRGAVALNTERGTELIVRFPTRNE